MVLLELSLSQPFGMSCALLFSHSCLPGSYWRNSWDWVDFIVVLASLANIGITAYLIAVEASGDTIDTTNL